MTLGTSEPSPFLRRGGEIIFPIFISQLYPHQCIWMQLTQYSEKMCVQSPGEKQADCLQPEHQWVVYSICLVHPPNPPPGSYPYGLKQYQCQQTYTHRQMWNPATSNSVGQFSTALHNSWCRAQTCIQWYRGLTANSWHNEDKRYKKISNSKNITQHKHSVITATYTASTLNTEHWTLTLVHTCGWIAE